MLNITGAVDKILTVSAKVKKVSDETEGSKKADPVLHFFWAVVTFLTLT